MGIHRIWSAGIAALVLALPVRSAIVPGPQTFASIGPVEGAVIDMDLNDGVEAAISFSLTEYRSHELVGFLQDLKTGHVTTSVFDTRFTESDAVTPDEVLLARPLTADTDFAPWRVVDQISIGESWDVGITPNTRVTIRMQASAHEAAPYRGRASASFNVGGQSLSEVLTEGMKTFEFSFTTGAATAQATFARAVQADTAAQRLGDPISPVPEPAAWAMMLAGMGAVLLRRRAQ
jgi:hypothetical protein